MRGHPSDAATRTTTVERARRPGSGEQFPDLELPDHEGSLLRLSAISRRRDPLAVVFYRGWW
jgi:peroxiredoxin